MPGQLLSICEQKESVRNCGMVSTVELDVECAFGMLDLSQGFLVHWVSQWKFRMNLSAQLVYGTMTKIPQLEYTMIHHNLLET